MPRALPEKGFVRPGYTLVMGDSHTCTHGAFGAFAAGVGTTDLEIAILKGVCAFNEPDTIRVDLDGALKPGVYAKDLILYVISRLGVAGATDKVIEFRGPVVDAMSMEGRMTLCKHGGRGWRHERGLHAGRDDGGLPLALHRA